MNVFFKVNKFLVALALAFALSMALTQEGEEADYVVVVYENVQEIVDVFSYPAEFFDIVEPFWPGIKVDLPTAPPNQGVGSVGGQQTLPNDCADLLLEFWNAVNEATQLMQDSEDVITGKINLVGENGKEISIAEKAWIGNALLRKAVLFTARQKNILQRMESRGCELPMTPLSLR